MRKALILALAIFFAGSLNLNAQAKETSLPECYLRFVPLAAHMGLGWMGVESRDNTLDRLIVAGVGFASDVVLVSALKYTISEERPDHSDFHSFPSGHTSYAFLGAELVRHEYGWGWGAAAYSVAAGVAVLRVCHDRHYWWDTVAGAGCGILAANIGCWTLKPIHRLFGMELPETAMASVAPLADPFTGSYGLAFNMTF